MLKNISRKQILCASAALFGFVTQASAANITCTAGENCTIGAGDQVFLNQDQTMTGTLTGEGRLNVVPSGNIDTRKDTLVVWEGSIADFQGSIGTSEYSSNNLGRNAIATLVLKNWSPDQAIQIYGNGDTGQAGGNVIFDGNNSVKLGRAAGKVYLNENTLDKASENVTGLLFFGGKDTDDQGRNLTLDGYNLPESTLFAGGSNNTVNGNVNSDVKNSVLGIFIGNGNNTNVNGNINVNVDNSTLKAVYGNDPYASTINSLVDGDINVNVNNSNVSGTVYGQSFKAFGDTDAGTTGKITVTVKDSVVGGGVRGSNLSNALDQKWISEHYKTGDIEINLENAVVGEEVLTLGSLVPAKGDLTINLFGDNYIGYTDRNGTESTASDVVVRAGTKRGFGVDGNTTINIDTQGNHTVKVRGAIIPGGEKDGTVEKNATLNLINSGSEKGRIEAMSFESGNVKGESALNLGNVEASASESVSGFKNINIDDSSVLSTKTLTLQEGGKLNITLTDEENYGRVNAETIDANNAELNFIVGSDGVYENVLNGKIISDFSQSVSNVLYNLSFSGGALTAVVKSGAELAQSLDYPITDQQTDALSAILKTGPNSSEKGNLVARKLSEAIQTGDIAGAVKGLKRILPTNSQMVLGIAKDTNRLLETAISNRYAESSGLNSGDMIAGNSVWIQGLYNHSRQNSASSSEGFSADIRGVSIGLDGYVNDELLLGLGYAYTNVDADTKTRKTDVYGNNFFVYGKYQPSQWYVNTMLNYGRSQYKEHKSAFGINLRGKYDVDAYGASLMTGYETCSSLTPEGGLRYLHIHQDSYNDGIQKIKNKNSDLLTAVLGIKYAPDYQTKFFALTPMLRLAATYDLISDKNSANVYVDNGDFYNYSGKRLHRFGVEGAIGLGVSVDNWDLTAEYNTSFRKDYQSHAGILKAQYNF